MPTTNTETEKYKDTGKTGLKGPQEKPPYTLSGGGALPAKKSGAATQ